WELWRGFDETCCRAANYVATHAYFIENTSEFFYIHDDVKLKIKDRENDPDGILNTSLVNTTYRLLSSKYKGEIPASILTQINSNVRKNFSAERKDYFTGKKSLRSYKRGMPIPISKKDIRNINKD